jgi:hypothetical protein
MVRYHTGIVKLGVAITSEPLLCITGAYFTGGGDNLHDETRQ